ncbi:MAG: polysaccharide pyruvyl transferase CsaB [Halanaerobiales bacterium]
MTKIVVSGYYGFDNLGDEAILMSMVRAFKSVKKDMEIVILSNNPEKTGEEYQVKAISRNNLLAFIKELKNCDLFISGGGSLLQDVTGWKTIPFYLGQIVLAKLLGKRTAVFSQGIGPVKRKFYHIMISNILGRVEFISVRDGRSRDLLKKWGIKDDKIKLSADPVFLLKGLIDDSKKLSSKRKKEKVFKSPGAPTIVVSVRPWMGNKYLYSFADSLSRLAIDINANVLIIPMHLQQDEDISIELCEIINNTYKDRRYQGQVVVDNNKYSPEELIALIKNADLLIGVRLHSVIFAALTDVPFVAIEYDPKVTAFLEMMSLNSGVKIDELDADKLLRISKSIWENRKQFKAILEQQGALLNKLILNNLITLLALTEENNDVQ